jgi:2-phospho-L-lactate transferase/gluconeogenesis factor (CofD/UPF0052 family)
LYTSIIPNLLVNGVAEALKASKAIKIYICNVMTQPEERKACHPARKRMRRRASGKIPADRSAKLYERIA